MKSDSEKQRVTIVRIWRGWTTAANAIALESVLKNEVIPSIEANKPEGLSTINLLVLPDKDEVQFTTIMYFDSMESVIQFAGENYTRAHIDPAVAPLLLRHDTIVEHHTLKESRTWNN